MMTEHKSSGKTAKGILLVNLGSPESPSVGDVRKYLHEFLMDGRVLDTPWLIRKFVVSCLILPFRPKTTAEAYRAIWRKEGSPLLVISRNTRELLQKEIAAPVALGMRYGEPSILSAVRSLLKQSGESLGEILLIPLYPHYAMSSYETAVVATQDALKRLDCKIPLRTHPPFYNDLDYIGALVESALPHLRDDYDHLLFSYHGLPERHMRKADPTGSHCLTRENCCSLPSPAHATCYRHQVFETTGAFVQKAQIPEGKYSVTFQSRLGREPWLKPYTDLELERLARSGVKKLRVICPAFVSDCLETLEEIEIRGRKTFLNAGGEDFRYIPCLNEHPAWIQVLKKWTA